MATPTPVTLHRWPDGGFSFRVPEMARADVETLNEHFTNLVGTHEHPDRARDAQALYQKYPYHPDAITFYGIVLAESGDIEGAVAVLRSAYGELTGLLVKNGVDGALHSTDPQNRPYARLAQHYLIQIISFARTLPEGEGRVYYKRALALVQEIKSFIPAGGVDYDMWVGIADVALGNFGKVARRFKPKGERHKPETWLTYAWAQFEKRNYMEGDRALRQVVGESPGHCVALLLPENELPFFNKNGFGSWVDAVAYNHFYGAAWRRSSRAMAHLRRYHPFLVEMLAMRNRRKHTRDSLPKRLAGAMAKASPIKPPFLIVESTLLFEEVHRLFWGRPDHRHVCECLHTLPNDVLEGFHNLDDVLESLSASKRVKDVETLQALRTAARKCAIEARVA